MGNCAMSPTTRSLDTTKTSQTTLKIIHTDGRLQEFTQPIKANQILSENPNCFLCISDLLYVNSVPPPCDGDEDLHLGELYFVMPMSKSRKPLSLQELCALAIQASNAIPVPSDADGNACETNRCSNHYRSLVLSKAVSRRHYYCCKPRFLPEYFDVNDR